MAPFAGFVAAIALACVVYYVAENRSYYNAKNSAAISPTAHYTGHVWIRNNLSDSRLETTMGYVLYHLLAPLMMLSKALKSGTLEEMLLTRHQLLDLKLDEGIQSGEITQVIEVAAGLSSRGARFSKRYGDKIIYIEADLPDMVELKRNLISYHPGNRHHQIVVVDALQTDDHAVNSIVSIVKNNHLLISEGTVIVTEGLVNYFDKDDLVLMWSKFASALSIFPRGMYVSDIHINDEHAQGVSIQIFKFVLANFVGRKVHSHFSYSAHVTDALTSAGFRYAAKVQTPSEWTGLEYCKTTGSKRVSIIDAKTSWK